jgi:hypothetical protein
VQTIGCAKGNPSKSLLKATFLVGEKAASEKILAGMFARTGAYNRQRAILLSASLQQTGSVKSAQHFPNVIAK